ncbi:MAG: hypothetical protein J7K21_07160, partial [Desulfurococcales archaeon]|nr:hypothetical protein [Desulfurococcales archaeon]
MNEQQSDMEFYLKLIDGINRYRGKDIDKITDELKISRATFFRKLKILKGKGFRRKVVFDYCGIGLKIAFLFLKSDSLINIIQYIKQIPGASYLYESFAPDRLFIMKLYLLDEKFLEKLYR